MVVTKASSIFSAISPGQPAGKRPGRFQWGLLAVGVLGFCVPLMAAVLPEDRADFLYHSYSGGGLVVNGPSILARKKIGKSVSMWGKYYVDSLTSATIDVVSAASEYHEERIEKSVGVDYLHDKSTLSLGYTNSAENDFVANTVNFGISHSLFGDLTTVSLGYTRGLDDVTSSVDPNFSESAERSKYRLGISQVLTKNMLMGMTFETVTDEGHLESPYRRVRFLDTSAATGVAYQGEEYPETRTSHALSISALYYLPYRAAIKAETRLFTDTWGVNASMYELGYVHPWKQHWIFELRYRAYQQDQADFYSDMFNRISEFNYHARDKELSTLNTSSIGLGASYEFGDKSWRFIDKGSVNLMYDRYQIDYLNFRNELAEGYAPGTEPMYSQTADVVRFFVSLWY
ncbi:MAG: DUF3570 domain-containing protein [Gammaproteobacteria bacterium]|nr:DUF3570 domain-containing protein [Gammaproteobacteria bacterium]